MLEIARRESVGKQYASRLLRVALLASEIIEQIVLGRPALRAHDPIIAYRPCRSRFIGYLRKQALVFLKTPSLQGCGKTRRKAVSAKSKHYYDHESASWINVVRGQKHFFRKNAFFIHATISAQCRRLKCGHQWHAAVPTSEGRAQYWKCDYPEPPAQLDHYPLTRGSCFCLPLPIFGMGMQSELPQMGLFAHRD